MKTGRWLLMAAAMTVPAPSFAHGPLDRAEMEKDRAAVFAQADADGSGTLSTDEFKAFKSLMRDKRAERRFKRIDANGDGGISLQELQADRPGPRQGHGPPPCER